MSQKLKESAEKLRNYLVANDFAGEAGDIPDDIWLSFCKALKEYQIYDCRTCRHKLCDIDEVPCCNCTINNQGSYDRWEPKT